MRFICLYITDNLCQYLELAKTCSLVLATSQQCESGDSTLSATELNHLSCPLSVIISIMGFICLFITDKLCQYLELAKTCSLVLATSQQCESGDSTLSATELNHLSCPISVIISLMGFFCLYFTDKLCLYLELAKTCSLVLATSQQCESGDSTLSATELNHLSCPISAISLMGFFCLYFTDKLCLYLELAKTCSLVLATSQQCEPGDSTLSATELNHLSCPISVIISLMGFICLYITNKLCQYLELAKTCSLVLATSQQCESGDSTLSATELNHLSCPISVISLMRFICLYITDKLCQYLELAKTCSLVLATSQQCEPGDSTLSAEVLTVLTCTLYAVPFIKGNLLSLVRKREIF